MKFFIVDDSLSIRQMLSEIILNEHLGTVEGEAEDGIEVTNKVLDTKEIDILLIDLLMPERDGIETIRAIVPHFKGKIIMISQVDQKDMVAEAYLLGIDHYITKPINKYEVISVIKKVTEHYLQEKSIVKIQQSLKSLTSFHQVTVENKQPEPMTSTIIDSGKTILMELGIVGEGGYYDLIDILEYLYQAETACQARFQFPSLKELFEKVAEKHYEAQCGSDCLKKEAKASEQRVRRAIHQALNNLASLGLTDYANPVFESYSSKLFDFSQVRMKMLELEDKNDQQTPCRLNIKKFIEVLYMEAKERMDD